MNIISAFLALLMATRGPGEAETPPPSPPSGGLGILGSQPRSPWPNPLAVTRCPYASPRLPAQSETALDATLLVRVAGGTGSAFMISSDGFALTAAHVVGKAANIDVVAHGGAKLSAAVVRVHEPQDVALIKVDLQQPASCLQPLIGRSPLGADVFILGSPAGEELSFSVSKGIVSGYRSFEQTQFVQLDASVNPGNSGGPAVDASGQVVGVASWKVSHVSMEGLAFAVPADVALAVLAVRYGDVSAEDWAQRRGRVTAQGFETLQASGAQRATVGTAAEPTGSPSGFNRRELRRQNVRAGFIAAGATSLAAGGFTILSTYLVYRLQRLRGAVPERRWKLVRGFNTAGWTFAIAGAAALTTGLIIPRRIKKRRGSDVAVAPTPEGIVVTGEF